MTERPIQILDGTTSLEMTLRSIKNSKVNIAVAFASKVEALIDVLLENGNTISLLVGTINNFTDPAFIRYCQNLSKIKPAKISIFVDFRGDNSIHWKLYLTGINTVIIGSSNLTSIGVSMKRDTAVVIQDATLHQSYLTKMILLKRDYPNDILHSQHAQFEQRLNEYELIHRKTFGQMLASRTSISDLKPTASIDFLDWIAQEKSHIVPLFIWGREVTDEEQRIFEQKVIPLISKNSESIGEFYIVGAYEETREKQNYHNGEVILMMKSNGTHIKFDLIDIMTYAQGNWWLCGLKSHPVNKPFTLTSALKNIIRQKAHSWVSTGKTYLDSKDLRELAIAVRTNQ